MLISRPIAILYFLARKTTAEGAEERRAFNHLFLLRVTPRTLRLNSRCGYSSPHVLGSPCIVKSPDSGFRYLGSYVSSTAAWKDLIYGGGAEHEYSLAFAAPPIEFAECKCFRKDSTTPQNQNRKLTLTRTAYGTSEARTIIGTSASAPICRQPSLSCT